jgi:D-glycero-alpha-D-manno-heptose-7-phosphate kinase
MIISRTPARISFFGGGTDYPQWFREHGGAVIGTTINRYTHVMARALPPFFPHTHRIVWSQIELVNELSDIVHPAVRAVLQEMKPRRGLEIQHNGDLPARSGMGSSSQFTVGLLNAMYALRGKMIGKRELAREAIRLEQEVMAEHVGSQDQVWAAYGGFNRIEFFPDGDFAVTPMVLGRERQEELRNALLLVFTGLSRNASDIAAEVTSQFASRRSQLLTMRALVDEAVNLLTRARSPVQEFGELLHEAWLIKRDLSKVVTTPVVDEVYDAARAAGALGGKLLGAGGGGFMLLVVPPERRANVKEKLSRLVQVDFEFEKEGSRIIVYDPTDAADV